MSGKLYGLGVGPGDPELLTLKAKRVLEEVDMICTPQSKKGRDSVALQIVKEEVDCQGRVKELLFPMIHDQDELNKFWDQATEEMVTLLEEGQDLAFITIGDPLLYSTYIYVLERIKNNHPEIEVETVPGITSIAASSSRVNIPLTEKDEKLVIVPATYDHDKLEEIIKQNENIVLLKVAKYYDQIVELLTELELQENAWFVSRCGQEDELITKDLDSLVGTDIDYLSMMIVKK
ncbi:precorrin-2 C(20)-methyltransferase [Natroniella sulfidigena]|uniref:precorrin-2 C(20)-methyltransferase n=1 Tax=Natroniella sulfidigena TaxID=723921 RepID=UPI00200AD4C1|nr:precorrin-2 C(20)-methyltransferase [Natroniella sulfidigena]MCK8817369.1 precorrin-2 C(20)-methyltransferase [Natroniella sulfidigena]